MNAAFSSKSFSTSGFSVQAFAFDVVERKGGSAHSDFDREITKRIRIARADSQDILDIATILGFVVDEL